MKKRFLIPLIATGAFTGIFVIGQSMIFVDINECNKEKIEACKRLAALKKFFGRDLIKNPKFEVYEAEARAERQKAEEQAKRDEEERIARLAEEEAKRKAETEAEQALKAEEAKRRAEEAKLWQPTSYGVDMLALDCETKHIRPYLKDPDSFKKLKHGYTMSKTHVKIWVNYTATNTYGGRVQNIKECSYTR